jgi:hypothetical protein
VPATEAEQRLAPRFATPCQPAWRELGTNWGNSRLAKVYNISATGVGLLCTHWIKPGTVLILTLTNECQQPSRPMSVRVMHATQQPDGQWLVGGAFTRKLSDAELQRLLPKDL